MFIRETITIVHIVLVCVVQFLRLLFQVNQGLIGPFDLKDFDFNYFVVFQRDGSFHKNFFLQKNFKI